MGRLIRCITSCGAVMATCVDTTDIVGKAEQYHKTSAVVTAALGRTLTAVSMIGNMLKGKDNTVTLKITGDGPIGSIVAASDYEGNVRGYVTNPIVELPLNNVGKLDVGGAVGKGILYVMKDLGLKEPYIGQIPLTTGEIAEDITAYYAVSEQTPTVCALGVMVNPDLNVKCAGGFIIQMLPNATDAEITKLEKSLEGLESVTTMLSKNMSPEDILRKALKEFEVEVLYEQEIEYKCKCSKERTKNVLSCVGDDDLKEMIEQEKETNVVCHFCNKEYIFTPAEIRQILDEKKNKKTL